MKFVSPALFWPESVKVQSRVHCHSILTDLSARSVIKLFDVAFRTPRQGRTAGSKRAIRVIVEIQTFKMILLSSAALFAFLNPIYYDRLGYWLLLVALLIALPLIDFVWNENLERSLRAELKERATEFDLADQPVLLKDIPPSLAALGEVQNISVPSQRLESGMESETLEELRQRLLQVGKRGSDWYDAIRHQDPGFEQAHRGEWIEINIETGKYVLAATEQEAATEFERQFGNIARFREHVGYRIHLRQPLRLLHSA